MSNYALTIYDMDSLTVFARQTDFRRWLEMEEGMNVRTMFVSTLRCLDKIYDKVPAVTFENCIFWQFSVFLVAVMLFFGNFHHFE